MIQIPPVLQSVSSSNVEVVYREISFAGDLDDSPQRGKGIDCSPRVVQRVARAQLLGKNVLHAGKLEHGPNCPASNYTSTRRRRAQHDIGTARKPVYLVDDGISLGEGNLDGVLFAISNTFLDGTDDVASFANTDANFAALVANNDNGPKAQFFTAFDDFANSPNLDDALL